MPFDKACLRGALPDQMVEARRWLIWRSETRNGAAKPSKLPYYLNGSPRGRGVGLDGPEDAERLGTFTDAYRCAKPGVIQGSASLSDQMSAVVPGKASTWMG